MGIGMCLGAAIGSGIKTEKVIVLGYKIKKKMIYFFY